MEVIVGTVEYKKPLAVYQVEKFIPHDFFTFSSRFDIGLIKVNFLLIQL